MIYDKPKSALEELLNCLKVNQNLINAIINLTSENIELKNEIEKLNSIILEQGRGNFLRVD